MFFYLSLFKNVLLRNIAECVNIQEILLPDTNKWKIEQQQQQSNINSYNSKNDKMTKDIVLFSKNSFISVVNQLNIATVSKTEFHNPIMFCWCQQF